ncbi:MAG TPA: pilus assembly protein PilM [Oligoflexus sp.]|uniref:pilus assembly protein PilM n=1 Tax=Oligoflexus sp. TaxID=1971216 RepID=UPI002D7F0300|nr:pilus assembly protein PilM [Oligoflexus sp.]HET9238571.1 pilus assembly protein PilM [Oligoflexus sp.]
MQKVIGLDIGSYSIKAIEIVNTFKSYEVVNFYETVIPNLDGVPLDAIVPICMEQLFQEHNLTADRIITAMPGQFISSRVIPFAFSDPRKIQQSIAVELEEYVPFNMEDMIVDHQILGHSKGQTMALAVMTRKAFLRNFLDLLSRVNIDPKLVDVDSLAFYNLCPTIVAQENECYALVDVGNEKTSVCIIKGGVLRMFRSINLGGRYITDFLARDLECSFHEAQRAKHEVSAVFHTNYRGEDMSEREKRIAERTTLAAHAIVKELGRTFYAYKTWDKEPINRVILTGGTSKLKHFDRFLTDQLELNFEKFDITKTNISINAALESKQEILPQSLAIGLRAVTNLKKHSQINLRRGEFAYVQNYEYIMKGVTQAFKVISLVLVLLMFTYIVKYYFYNQQIEKVKEQYVQEFLTNFPELKKKYSDKNITFKKLRSDAENKLRGGIRDKQAAVSEFMLANSESGPLRVLKEISEVIPKTTKIDVTEFDFRTTQPGVGKLTMRAETDNFASQSAIIEALGKAKSLRKVEEKSSGAKPGSNGQVIEFTIQAEYVHPNSEAAKL